MTSKPDQSAAAAEAAENEISASDPVEQPTTGGSEQQSAPEVAGDGAADATDSPDEVDPAADADSADAGDPTADGDSVSSEPEAPAVPVAAENAVAESPTVEAQSDEGQGDEGRGDEGQGDLGTAEGSPADEESPAAEPPVEDREGDEQQGEDATGDAPGEDATGDAPVDDAPVDDATGDPQGEAANKDAPVEDAPAEDTAATAGTAAVAEDSGESLATDPGEPPANDAAENQSAPEDEEPSGPAAELPRRPKPVGAPTEEIRIVAPPATPAEAPAAAAAETNTDTGEPSAPEPAADAADADAKKPDPKTPDPDEPFDFKALSFAAISAAHKKAVGPRTVASETSPADPEPDGSDTPASVDDETPREQEPARAAGAATEASGTADAELFAPPADRQTAPAAPPNPFPTQTAPAQLQLGTPARPEAVQPRSPSPAAPGGPAQQFPAVHDYAPETSYVGWRPPTAQDQAVKRRRYTLIGAAVLGVAAVIAVIVLTVNAVGKQQWEPIEAMLNEPKEVHPLQLVLGSCVESIDEDGEVSEVLAVPCDLDHTAQVVGRTDFADAAVWPGRDDVDKRVAQVCGTKQLGPTARTSPVTNNVSYVVWSPSEKSWEDGDRVGLCLATTADPITQDLLQ